MTAAANMVELAALVGNTARAMMLAALMGGKALTSSELAGQAGISRSTASEHLGKLRNAGLLNVIQRRRNRYYKIASPLVARMLESMKQVAAIELPPRHRSLSPQDNAVRYARTCYDHLAGRLGVAVADALVAQRYVVLTDEGGEVTPSGRHLLTGIGADFTPENHSRRIFCRPCLDWSERRYHIGGFIGAEICRCCEYNGWIRRSGDSRAVSVTPAGRRHFRELLGIDA
jgi:DNA-binding transcriptional ArsR family regulator